MAPQPRTFLITVADAARAVGDSRTETDPRTGLLIDPADNTAYVTGLADGDNRWIYVAHLTPHSPVSDEEVTDHGDGTYTVGGPADGRTFGLAGCDVERVREHVRQQVAAHEHDLPLARAVLAHIDATQEERVTQQARAIIDATGSGVGGAPLDVDTVKALLRGGYITGEASQ